MAIHYVCKHCRTSIGQIDAAHVTESQLGLHFLTPAERRDIIAYNSNGEMIVNITCDYCNEAILVNPELSLLTNPLQ
ncbi:anti-sigma-F factor Fin family protein [Neobacillus mesonae]|nr:anti-sigma-F factor Fin family protein [Neobacillus mesonae]